MKNIITLFNNKKFIFVFLLVLILSVCNVFLFYERMSMVVTENITSFSFWNYIRVFGTGELIMFIAPLCIVYLGIESFHEKITSSFMKFELTRMEYKKKMLKELLMAYIKGFIIFVLISVIFLIVGVFLFPSDMVVQSYDYLNFFPIEGFNNPWLYVFKYHLLIVLFSMLLVNIGIIITYFIRDIILITIASFIGFNAINFVIGNIIVFSAQLIGNEHYLDYAYNFNVYEGYVVQGTIGQAFFDIGILYIVTTIILIFLYKNKEKVVMHFD